MSTFTKEEYDDKYFYLTSPKPNPPDRIAFSELLERARSYESAPDIFDGTQSSTNIPRPINVGSQVCQRCLRPIGDRPFCYRCFGPPAKPKKCPIYIYMWSLAGACLSILILSCLAMCLMHIWNIGLYKEDNITKLQKEMETSKSMLRYLTGLSEGFIKETVRNMSSIFENLTKMQKTMSSVKGWSNHLKKIKEFLNASCEEYLKTSDKTNVGKICKLVKNGTYFT